MDIKNVFRNNKDWITKKLTVDPSYFENLSKGQNPEAFFIGCSDSRISVDTLLTAEMGDVLFIETLPTSRPITTSTSFLL